jgi:hypothetical protein
LVTATKRLVASSMMNILLKFWEPILIPANPNFFRVLLVNCYGWSVG